MIREQDGANACLLGVAKHFEQCAARVSRIFGVSVQDAAIIVQRGQRRNVPALGVQLLDIVMNGGKPASERRSMFVYLRGGGSLAVAADTSESTKQFRNQ